MLVYQRVSVEIAYLQCATSAKLTHAKKIQKVTPKFPVKLWFEADLHIAHIAWKRSILKFPLHWLVKN